MTKRVLDVGQCAPDHQTIRSFLESHFDVRVVQTHGAEDTLQEMKNAPYDLVLINRTLDRDHSDGLEIIRQIKDISSVAHVPVMLVTNYPEHQNRAVAAGAERGFGKLEFDQPETLERLRQFLGIIPGTDFRAPSTPQ